MEDDREPGVDESLLAVVAYDRPPGERLGPVDVGERERQGALLSQSLRTLDTLGILEPSGAIRLGEDQGTTEPYDQGRTVIGQALPPVVDLDAETLPQLNFPDVVGSDNLQVGEGDFVRPVELSLWWTGGRLLASTEAGQSEFAVSRNQFKPPSFGFPPVFNPIVGTISVRPEFGEQGGHDLSHDRAGVERWGIPRSSEALIGVSHRLLPVRRKMGRDLIPYVCQHNRINSEDGQIS